MINKKRVEKYQDIYRDEVSENITYDEAADQAAKLTKFIFLTRPSKTFRHHESTPRDLVARRAQIIQRLENDPQWHRK